MPSPYDPYDIEMRHEDLRWKPTVISVGKKQSLPYPDCNLNTNILEETPTFNVGDIIPVVLKNKKVQNDHLPYFQHVYLAVITHKSHPASWKKDRPNYIIKFYYDGEIRQHPEERLVHIVQKSTKWMKKHNKGKLVLCENWSDWDLLSYYKLVDGITKIQRAFRKFNKKKQYNGLRWRYNALGDCWLSQKEREMVLGRSRLGWSPETFVRTPEIFDNIDLWNNVVNEIRNTLVLQENKVNYCEFHHWPENKYIDSLYLLYFGMTQNTFRSYNLLTEEKFKKLQQNKSSAAQCAISAAGNKVCLECEKDDEYEKMNEQDNFKYWYEDYYETTDSDYDSE